MPRAPRASSPHRRARSRATVSGDVRPPDGARRPLPVRSPNPAGAQQIRANGGRPSIGHRVALLLLGLTTAVLVANAIAGERGLVQTFTTRRAHQQLAESISRLQRENRRLALQAERLRHDPSAIEELARGELGLVRPGEQLFIIIDRTVRER